MNHEYFTAHAYMAMAAYCDKEIRTEGFAKLLPIQQAKRRTFPWAKDL